MRASPRVIHPPHQHISDRRVLLEIASFRCPPRRPRMVQQRGRGERIAEARSVLATVPYVACRACQTVIHRDGMTSITFAVEDVTKGSFVRAMRDHSFWPDQMRFERIGSYDVTALIGEGAWDRSIAGGTTGRTGGLNAPVYSRLAFRQVHQ